MSRLYESDCPATLEAVREREDGICPLCGRPASRHKPERSNPERKDN